MSAQCPDYPRKTDMATRFIVGALTGPTSMASAPVEEPSTASTADVSRCNKLASLLDHLVGAGYYCSRYG
jgi:hypothetical protein